MISMLKSPRSSKDLRANGFFIFTMAFSSMASSIRFVASRPTAFAKAACNNAARVNEAARTPLLLMACSKLLDELVASSDLIAGETEQKLRSYLREGGCLTTR